jgi:hypothetical protein
MAIYNIKVNSNYSEIYDTGIRNDFIIDEDLHELLSDSYVSINQRFQSHAIYLNEQGSLCQPKCVAACGNIILSK